MVQFSAVPDDSTRMTACVKTMDMPISDAQETPVSMPTANIAQSELNDILNMLYNVTELLNSAIKH